MLAASLTSPPSANSSGFARVRTALERVPALLLAFLLSLLPAAILQREVQEIRQLQRERTHQSFREQAQHTAKRVQVMTKLSYRLKDLTRRVKHEVERRIDQTHLCERDLLQAEIARAMQQIKHFAPEVRVWAGILPQGDPQASPELLQGSGFETEFKTFFITLFREMLRSGHGLSNALGDEVWLPRLQNTFGNGVGNELFSAAAEGEAFAVVFRHQFHIRQWNLIWRYLGPRHRPVGIMLYLEPASGTFTTL
ncbi:MAG TPA: hypothetical protein PKO06_14935, partial [Candidatus Ozemobacteraceae bacterium]|nr:hypothetical protein [Candidatus Ozemobacteraceae bacterium]